MKIMFFAIVALFVLISCTTLGRKDSLPIVRHQIHMGTQVTIKGFKTNDQFEKAFFAIGSVDSLLSTYIPQSAIARLNNQEKVILDSKLLSYLTLAADMQSKTLNFFDPTLGAYTKKFKTHNNYKPGKLSVKLSSILKHQSSHLKLPKGVQLDFGGIGKGIALWEASSLFNQSENNFMIKASGDIYCHITCNIEVEKPFEWSKNIRFKTCNNKSSISTSGNYRNYIKDKKNNNHLLNPKTKRSQNKTASITVVTTDPPYVADALSTALAVAPSKKDRDAILKNFNASYIHISNENTYEYGLDFESYFCDYILN